MTASKETDLLPLKLDSANNITDLEVGSCLETSDKGLSLIWALGDSEQNKNKNKKLSQTYLNI